MPAFLAVLLPQALLVEVTSFVPFAGTALVFVQRFSVVVGVDEAVVAGVVRWVDVDHLDLAVVAFLQYAQHFKVFAFDQHVRGTIGVVGGGAQRVAGAFLDFAPGGALASPAQLVVFGTGDVVLAQQRLEGVDVELVVLDEGGFDLTEGGQQVLLALRQRIGAVA